MQRFASTHRQLHRPLLLVSTAALLTALVGCGHDHKLDAHKLEPRVADATVQQINVVYYDYDFRPTDEQREDRALVFIHGWSCNHTFWRFQRPIFSRFDRVLLVDLPGHGASDQPERPYTPELFAQAVRAVMDDAGVQEAFLIGHSMGWMITREFLFRYPDRVLGVVNVDGLELDPPADADARAAWKAERARFVDQHSGDTADDAVREMITEMRAEATPPELIREVTAEALQTPVHVRASALANAVDPLVWRKGYWPKTPALVVYARSPELDAERLERLRTQFPHMELVVWDDVSHFLMMERPGAFNRLLVEFVEEHTVEFVKPGPNGD